MEQPTLADFLQRALVWPDPDDPLGWVNLHWRRQEQKGITGGQAFKTLDEIIGFIRWAMGKGKAYVADLYYCTSLQREHGDPKPNGRWGAQRSIDNAVSSRLLFADVDKYATKLEAAAAIKSFCDKSGSPYPTALVDSGGGLHAYWILPRTFVKEEWLTVAAKFDGLLNEYNLLHDNISTDMARILRPPETLNYKRIAEGPPQPVVLKLLNGAVDIDNWASLYRATPAPIKAHSSPSAASGGVTTSVEKLFINSSIAVGGPASVFSRVPLEERLGQGSLDPAPILRFCPMFQETLAFGGKDVGQPVWHQQALATTFFLGGRELFHNLGREHPHYSLADSEAMFDRKLRDRLSKNLGYPSCAAFEADGAKQCKTCPIKGKVPSPLNITHQFVRRLMDDVNRKIDGPMVVVDAQTQEVISLKAVLGNAESPSDRIELPPKFQYRGDFICYQSSKKTYEEAFLSIIYKAELVKDERGAGNGMRIVCSSDGPGSRVSIVMPSETFASGTELAKVLNAGGAAVASNPSLTTKLMCSMRGRLMLAARAQRAIPFGWVFKEKEDGGEDQAHPIGFSYGGKVYYADGDTKDTYGGDAKLLDTYCITGLPDNWFEALKVILDTKSAGLQCLTLAGFAAPLIYLTGQYGTAFMAMGESGGSKSSAVAVGVAAWAKHKSAMMKPTASNLGVMKRMGKIRHLVTVWDDIQKEFFDTLKPTLIQITQGSEGLKLDQSRNERQEGEWDSMVVTTSNDSLAGYLEEHTKNNSSGLVRCFEIQLAPINKGDVGYVDNDQMAPLFASLNSNHGHMGREYAKMLGQDPASVKKLLEGVGKRIKDQIEPYETKERFWLAAAQTLLTAGYLTNTLLEAQQSELRFDVAAIEKFLVDTFRTMRKRVEGAKVNANKSQYAKVHLSSFLNHAGSEGQMLWSKEMPAGRGRPSAGCAPMWPIGLELKRMKRATVRWLTTDRLLRLSKAAFDAYLRSAKVDPSQVLSGLQRFYDARLMERVTMAAGVPDVSGGAAPELIIEIEVNSGSWLEGMLDRHLTPDDEQEIALARPRQSRDQPAPHPPLGREALEDDSDASSNE